MNLDCTWLKEHTALACHTVEAVDGSQAVRVQTANTWFDGSPLTFYIINQGNSILLTDDCETLFHFHAQGLAEHSRAAAALRDKLQCTGSSINMDSDGEIIAIGNADHADRLIADYISALCALMHHEREILGIPRQSAALADEVEMYLKAWKPKAKFSRNAEIKGYSGHIYRFDIAMDDKLILTLNPSPAAVGAAMRKAGDISMSDNLQGRELMAIVDNRGEDLFQTKAEEEIKILSSLMKALPLTNIIEKTPAPSNIQ